MAELLRICGCKHPCSLSNKYQVQDQRLSGSKSRLFDRDNSFQLALTTFGHHTTSIDVAHDGCPFQTAAVFD